MERDPRIGQDFGDYIVTRKIAEGGMGAVYLAEHSSGMRKVVKFMLAEWLQQPAIRQRFEKECAAAKRMKGRAGIVDIDSFGVRNGEMYLVMEYLDGVTLEAHIHQNVRLTPHHTFHIAVQILRALDALHKEGIIHRDLKPSNVFLRETDDRPWDVKLIDFGIVHDNRSTTSAEFRTRQGQMIGTPGYMATEQYGRADQVTPATDIFACAVIMWQMLTGELPWGIAPNEFAQHDRQANQVPVWPAGIAVPNAEEWPPILISALAPEPARRPQSAQAFALLLAEKLAPIPPHVPSGIQMVEQLNKRFLQNLSPDLETVRHANAQQAAAAFWPPRTPIESAGKYPASSPSLDAIPVSAVSPPGPVSTPTVNARPNASGPNNVTTPAVPLSAPGVSVSPSGVPTPAPPNSPMTTLSALNGVTTASAPAGGSRLIAIGIGTALVVAGVTFGVTKLGSRSSTAPASEEKTSVEPRSRPVQVDSSGSTAPAVAPPAQPAPTTPPPESTDQTGSRALATSSGEAAPLKNDDKTSREASPVRQVPSTSRSSKRAKAEAPARPQANKDTSSPSSVQTKLSAPSSSKIPERTGSDAFDPDAIKE